MSGFSIRQVVLDHLAGKVPIDAVLATDSAFDYRELPELSPTLMANDLHAIAGQLRYILEHLPPDEIAWRRVFLVRDEDGSHDGRLMLCTKSATSRPTEPRVTVCAVRDGEGVIVKGGDKAGYRTYLDREAVEDDVGNEDSAR